MFSYAVIFGLVLSFQRIQGFEDDIEPSQIIQSLAKSFEKSLNNDDASVYRTERSVSGQLVSCPNSTRTYAETLNEDRRNITCRCPTLPSQNISWLDIYCKTIPNNDQFQSNNGTLTFAFLNLGNDAIGLFYCTNGVNCTNQITVSEEIRVGMSRALQGFVMFLLMITLLGLLIFIFKQYRFQIYLGCRDCCTSSKADDISEFDAYISVGKSISDIKFVEKNIVDVLQLKHNYKVFVDDDNLLPRLDYSHNVQTKMHQSRRLIIVFTPAYMTNEWCMYCFAEGLRKLLELNTKLIFIVTDVSIQSELNALSSLIGQVPKLFLSTLPMMQSKADKERTMHKLRMLMPPSPRGPAKVGMKAPMLGNAEEIDQRSVQGNDTYGGTKYTFGNQHGSSNDQKNETGMDDFDTTQQDFEYDVEVEDPASIRVNQYKPRLDFLKITTADSEEDEK